MFSGRPPGVFRLGANQNSTNTFGGIPQNRCELDHRPRSRLCPAGGADYRPKLTIPSERLRSTELHPCSFSVSTSRTTYVPKHTLETVPSDERATLSVPNCASNHQSLVRAARGGLTAAAELRRNQFDSTVKVTSRVCCFGDQLPLSLRRFAANFVPR